MLTAIALIALRLIAFAIPIIVIYSLIKPKKFNICTKNNKDSKHSRSKFYLLMAVAWVFVIAIGSVIADNYYSAETAGLASNDQEYYNEASQDDYSGEVAVATNEFIDVDDSQLEDEGLASVEDSIEVESGTFNVNLDQFDKNIEDLSKKMGVYDESEGETDRYTIVVGDTEDTFTEDITENESMNGVLSKSGNIKRITFIKDKALESGDNVTVFLAALSTAAIGLDPRLDYDANQGIFLNTLENAQDQFKYEGSGAQKASIGNIIYTVKVSEELGTQVNLLPYF